jgi:hypothetical protein
MVSHVCRHWREVALGLPSLWNQIPARASLPCIQEYVARSRPRSLVVAPFVDMSERELDPALFGVLRQEVPRIAHLELVSTPNLLHNLAAQHGPNVAFPALDSLVIRSHNYSSGPAPYWLFPSVVMPRLRTLSVYGLPMMFSTTLLRGTLRRLNILYPFDRLSPDALVDILRDLPLLEELSVLDVFAD